MSKLIFERSKKGRRACLLPKIDVPETRIEDIIDKSLINEEDINLPEVTELELMRHFIELSQKNYCIEKGIYPLGSCTMKYNPKINEKIANLPTFKNAHPLLPKHLTQGNLELMYELQNLLAEILGLPYVTLQPSAGAHGELTGMLIIKEYFKKAGIKKTKVIVPDSSHGTNPSTARMCGYEVIEIKSNEKGQIDINELKQHAQEDVAAIMLTNPNTLGIFEENILKIADIMHSVGALLYYDGANLNAIMGHIRPGDMGFDIVHVNTHKTFSTPHGGGGPGSGPVAVSEKLKDFLPVPVINKKGDRFFFDHDIPNSIGKVRSYYGNFSILVRTYAYILSMGGTGLKQASTDAVLNANYLKEKLKKYYKLPYDSTSMHEFVLSGDYQKEKGVSTMDIAKRLLDFGIHPPTIYFPLIVSEAIMIEPTETESKEELDEFIKILIQLAEDAESNPESFAGRPKNTPIKRVNEVLAAKKTDLAYKF